MAKPRPRPEKQPSVAASQISATITISDYQSSGCRHRWPRPRPSKYSPVGAAEAARVTASDTLCKVKDGEGSTPLLSAPPNPRYFW
jgi:hypothetical protein